LPLRRDKPCSNAKRILQGEARRERKPAGDAKPDGNYRREPFRSTGLAGGCFHDAVNARGTAGREGWGRKTAWALGLVLLGLGLGEALVRLAGPRLLNGYRGIYFGGDTNSPVLFINDPWLHWRLRPGADVAFLHTRVQVNAGGLRGAAVHPARPPVLCVGGSTVFGWRVEEHEAFPAQLADLLNSAVGANRSWQVLNAGVPGYSSWQVRLYLPELLRRWRPRGLIVCVGNNECWPARRSDRERYQAARFRAPLAGLLQHSRLFLYLRDSWRLAPPAAFIAPALQGAEVRVGPAEFADNLNELVELAREQRVPLILAVPPANEQHPPQRLGFEPNLDRLQQQWAAIMPRVTQGDVAGALALCDRFLRAEPERFDLLWLRGMILTRSGRSAEGQALLDAAFERQAFPELCRPSYRQAIRACAAAQGVPCVDLYAVLLNAAGGGPATELFVDWCHPTPAGHALMARALRDAVRQLETAPAR